MGLTGSSGFGINNWCHRQRPRKPFSRNKNNDSDCIQKYEREYNQIEQSKLSIENVNSNLIYYKTRINRRRNRQILTSIIIVTLLLALISYFSITIPKINKEIKRNDKKLTEAIKEREKKEDEHASYISTGSGKRHLRLGETEIAIKDFKRAICLKPDNREAHLGLLKAFFIDCKKKNLHCKEFKMQFEYMVKYFPDKDLNYFKAEYELMN